MMKLTYANKEEYPEITGEIHPNDFPKEWREISSEEFSKSIFFTYTPSFIEYRQMYDSTQPQVPMLSARLFHFHDGTGVAISADYCHPSTRHWEEKIHYYKFGCDHKYKELSKSESQGRDIPHYGMCWHVYECSTCGNLMSTDSSD